MSDYSAVFITPPYSEFDRLWTLHVVQNGEPYTDETELAKFKFEVDWNPEIAAICEDILIQKDYELVGEWRYDPDFESWRAPIVICD